MVKASFVTWDFLSDWEEGPDGKPLLHPGTNRCVIKARSAKGALPPGTIHWGDPYEGEGERGNRTMAFICPCGCGEADFIIAAKVGAEARRAWQWDGNLEKPTLAPSIWRRGAACQWHGFLRAGEWTNA